MKNIAQFAAVIEEFVIRASKRNDVVAQHHRHWLLPEPAAWEHFFQMMAKRFFAPVVACRYLRGSKKEARQTVRMNTCRKYVYLVILRTLGNANRRLDNPVTKYTPNLGKLCVKIGFVRPWMSK